MTVSEGGEGLARDDVDGDDVSQDAAGLTTTTQLAELLSDHEVSTL